MTSTAAQIEWLSELISVEAADKQTGEFTIPLDDERLALIVPEELAVYLITVQVAQFTPVSNRESESDA